jgi:hypothetical protein
VSKDLYGDVPLNRSQGDPELRFTKKFTNVKDIDDKMADQLVTVRGRCHTKRGKGKIQFIKLR